jgi:hypothetical protein
MAILNIFAQNRMFLELCQQTASSTVHVLIYLVRTQVGQRIEANPFTIWNLEHTTHCYECTALTDCFVACLDFMKRVYIRGF